MKKGVIATARGTACAVLIACPVLSGISSAAPFAPKISWTPLLQHVEAREMVRSWYGKAVPFHFKRDAGVTRPGQFSLGGSFQFGYYVPERFTRKSAPKPQALEAKRPASSISNGLSCEAATIVVISYAFSDVRPMSCSGESYQFQAMRENYTYSIVLKAKDGELIQVKKLVAGAVRRDSN